MIVNSFIGMSDADIAHHLARCIPGPPKVRWTDYGTIAEAVRSLTPTRARESELNGWRVAMLLLPREHAPWHRLRNKDGIFNVPRGRPNPEQIQAARDQQLRDEGCPVDASRIAHRGHFIGAAELLQIAGITPLHDPLAAARAADPDLQARVAARRAARRADRPY
jgi:hypothetical protein